MYLSGALVTRGMFYIWYRRVTFFSFFAHSSYYLRTFSFSFSLPRLDSDAGSLSRLFFPPPQYCTRLFFCHEKGTALSSRVDSHRMALGSVGWLCAPTSCWFYITLIKGSVLSPNSAQNVSTNLMGVRLRLIRSPVREIDDAGHTILGPTLIAINSRQVQPVLAP